MLYFSTGHAVSKCEFFRNLEPVQDISTSAAKQKILCTKIRAWEQVGYSSTHVFNRQAIVFLNDAIVTALDEGEQFIKSNLPARIRDSWSSELKSWACKSNFVEQAVPRS